MRNRPSATDDATYKWADEEDCNEGPNQRAFPERTQAYLSFERRVLQFKRVQSMGQIPLLVVAR